jgi:hypothetical protein
LRAERQADGIEGSRQTSLAEYEETNRVVEILTIPLRNLVRETEGAMNLDDDSQILAWKSLPLRTRELIGKSAQTEYDYVLQTPARAGENARVTLDRALTVFKLFKDSLVLANLVFGADRLLDQLPHYVHWLDKHRGLPVFKLSKSEEVEFIRYWSEFIDVPPENFAVLRFHLADYRAYSRDRYVDYVESLEYLLVPDSDEGEIGYKFRSRGCLILGENGDASDRERIYKELREAYSLRSAILHGDVEKESKTVRNGRWEDKLQPIRHYDRQAIRYFFRARCLSNSKKRRDLFERKLFSVRMKS